MNKCKDCNTKTKGCGLRCRSCEAKRKHRLGILNSKGKHHPGFGKVAYWIKGDKNPNWNNGITKKKCHCIDCDKILGDKAIFKGTKRCTKCESKFRVGPNHPNWLGGITKEGYSYKFDYKLKEKIRTRDGHKCQKCGKKESDLKGLHKKLTVHHIDYNKQNCKEDNLITLCEGCNIRANYNRKYWKLFYNSKMIIIKTNIYLKERKGE